MSCHTCYFKLNGATNHVFAHQDDYKIAIILSYKSVCHSRWSGRPYLYLPLQCSRQVICVIPGDLADLIPSPSWWSGRPYPLPFLVVWQTLSPSLPGGLADLIPSPSWWSGRPYLYLLLQCSRQVI